jgi:hypothetical protein
MNEYFSLEDRNYYSDYRVRAKEDIWWESIENLTAILKDRTEDGKRQSVRFVYEVCPLCNGKGSHVNPSIDASGLTSEDFYNDPEFFEDYRSGVYNIPCNLCSGLRVIPKATGEPVTLEEEEDDDDEPYIDGDWN